MSIRLQLLVIALTTLVLPWAGCQYARELESTLRVSQESSLLAAADTIANALSAQGTRVFGAAPDRSGFDAAGGDLYVFPLNNEPLLDGYREEWNVAAEPKVMPTHTGLSARLQTAETDRYLYFYLEVDDAHFDPAPNEVRPDSAGFDRVDLTLERPGGGQETYFLATSAPGPLAAQSIVHGEDGVAHAVSEPRIQAFWLQISRGYHVEGRIPRSMIGGHLWIEAIDGGGAGRAGVAHAGDREDAVPGTASAGGRLFLWTPGLGELLATFIRPGTRATVIDTNALKLGTAGALPEAAEDAGGDGGSWYRHFIVDDTSHWPVQVAAPDQLEGPHIAAALAGRSAAVWQRAPQSQASLLSAAAPIRLGADIRGAVVLEQAGDQLLDSRDRALAHLFNLTLLGTALAAVIAVGIATWISVRIGRLQLAADSAVTEDGRIRLAMPGAGSGDEIGALARAFERLLGRLNEHTQYLRTLGGKLSHELRTPLTIVRSSLDNLESEGARDDQRGYLTRAREGTQRLQSILSALGAAARVEESIRQAERVNFDLEALLQSAVAGYRVGFASTRFELTTPGNPCFLQGAPDLLVQLLDKLVENAVDFCSPGGCVQFRLVRAGSSYELSVSNDGPPIPPEMPGRLFESLFEHRLGVDDRPHFGLGLYIVRLIAEFHGGRATAANRPDGRGAVFSVQLPLI